MALIEKIPAHILIARMEHAIKKDQREFYSACCRGDDIKANELRERLDLLNKSYFAHHYQNRKGGVKNG